MPNPNPVPNPNPNQVVAVLASKLPLDAVDRKGRTACYLAAAHAHPSALRALLACGADCTLRARDGSAPLDATSDEECRLLLGGAARELAPQHYSNPNPNPNPNPPTLPQPQP